TVEVHPLRIPLPQSFAHARMDRDASDAVVVRVTGKDGSIGHGEGVPRPYVTGEGVDDMVTAILSELAPLVRERTFAPGMKVLDDLRALRDAWNDRTGGRNATYCAVELALLDWAFRRAGLPLSEWLAPMRQEVVYSGVIEAADPEAAAELARRYASAGFAAIKVKVGVGDDERRLAAVREAVGQDIALRVDANGVWSADEAVRALARLRGSAIEAVEQPVPAADLAGMCRVREESGLAVVADESLITVEDARRLVDKRACDVFNVRVSKCGGLLASVEIAEVAAAAGLDVQVGAQVGETSLLSAAGRHLAAWLPSVRYVEGSFGTHLLREDVTAHPVIFGQGGRADLLTGDGLGVDVDDDSVHRLTAAEGK
ncbi:MAG: enolase, partial [Chloroflexi bacterium]|nr:enolase [Chloroflexota bacterium]